MVTGNEAAGLGAVYAGATVCAWYPITPSTSLAEGFEKHAKRMRVDKDGKQALRHRAGRGRAGGDRRGHRRRAGTARARSRRRRGPGISLMSEFLGLAYFAEIPVVLFNIQRGGPSTGMPTRTGQPDIISCAYASHGDTKHVLLFPSDPTECFSMGADAFDLAERLQTPVMVMSDLDIGMNDWVTDPVRLGRHTRPDRGKVLTPEQLESFKDQTRQAVGPLSRRRRRRDPLPHAAGHASDDGRVLHARHQPRRVCALHRGWRDPRARPRSHSQRSSTPLRRSCRKPEIDHPRQDRQDRRHLLRRHAPAVLEGLDELATRRRPTQFACA